MLAGARSPGDGVKQKNKTHSSERSNMHLHTMAGWAAAIFTIALLLKLAGHWRRRHPVEAALSDSSTSMLGNRIYLRNRTGRPLHILRWRLYVADGLLQTQALREISCFDGSRSGILIAPHASHLLFFSDEGLFNRSAAPGEGQRLYIGIETAGGQIATRCLYPGNHPVPALRAALAAWRLRQKRLARE